MSAILWTSDEDGIDLGPSMAMLAVFKELAQTAKEEYPALYGVPHAANVEVCNPEYAKSVAKDAKTFLVRYGGELSQHAVWVLQQLTGEAAPTEMPPNAA